MKWRATHGITQSTEKLILQQDNFKPKNVFIHTGKQGGELTSSRVQTNALANSGIWFFIQHCCLISLLL